MKTDVRAFSVCKICCLVNYRISSVIRRSFFSFQNNPKDLDPSCDRSRSLGLFWKGKIGIIAKFHRTDLVI